MTNLESEILTGINFMQEFNSQKILEFISKIDGNVLFAAMGSSFMLPSGRAQSIADELGVSGKIRSIFASEGYAINPVIFNSVVLISNSGKTREVIELAKKFPKEKISVITSDSKSELAKLAGNLYILQSGKEKAVAATKSIVEQTIICENIVRKLANKPLLLKKEFKEVTQAMKTNLNKVISSKLLVLIAGAKTIYFAGGSCGIGEEIALKFNELAKKKTRFIPGTQILHGPEEVIEHGDVVFLMFPDKYKKYEDRFKEMKEKNKAYFISVGSNMRISDCETDIELVSGFKPYCILAYFWNILTKFAELKGYSLDKGEKISKVGVHITR